jgi:hypothetical protein
MNSEYLAEARKLEGAWAKSKMLQDIPDVNIRRATAVLMENQKLVNEAMTDTGDVAQFKRISIPLVRRIYPQLISNKIVSVQPLLGPAGLVYYMRFRYSSNKGDVRGNTLQSGYPSDDSVSMQQLASGDGNLSIYYTHQFVQNETSSTHPGGTNIAAIYAPLEHTPVIAGTLTGTVYSGTTAIQTFVVNSAGTFTFSDIGTVTIKAQASGSSVDLNTGEITLQWTGGDPSTNHFVASYEYNLEAQGDLPEVNLVVESEEIVAKARKLKAAWTQEVQQDLRSQHNLDAEAELTAILAQEINLEIDREILTDLRNNAGTIAVWDFNTALGDTVKEKYESLFVKVTEVSAVVHRKTLRGGCNWLVTSPEVAAIFETATAGFAPAPSDTFT